jgi:putative transposase
MARGPRVDIGGEVYHVLNRANGRLTIFDTEAAYHDFEYLLNEMREQFEMRILAYALMPNHWHLLLHPRNDGDLATCMRWLGTSHSRRYHAQTKTIGCGHLYQGRYKSFIVKNDQHLLTVLKYIERNPVRAGLVERAEEWRWGSAYRRIRGSDRQKIFLTESPVPLPHAYVDWIHDSDEQKELAAVRLSVNKGVPYGAKLWRDAMIEKYRLHQTIRGPGQPKYN